jgi:hypothetical protein
MPWLEGTGGLIHFGGPYRELRLGNIENSPSGSYIAVNRAVRIGDSENIPDTGNIGLQKDTELIVEGAKSISGLAGTGRVRPRATDISIQRNQSKQPVLEVAGTADFLACDLFRAVEAYPRVKSSLRTDNTGIARWHSRKISSQT